MNFDFRNGRIFGPGTVDEAALEDALAATSGPYLGTWNAATNTPTITPGSGVNGATYDVAVAGTQNITGSPTAFAVGDKVRFTTDAPARWVRLPATDAVTSVNGQTGPVTVTKGTVGLGSVENIAPADMPVSHATQAALDMQAGEISQRAIFFSTRAALRAAMLVIAGGALASDGKVFYVKDGGASISDMAGWSPFGTVSLDHYGVDGSGSADNSARINAALAFAAGRVIIFPKPAVVYTISGSLNIPANTHIIGPGKNVPCLRYVAATGTGTATMLLITDVAGVTVEDLMLDGNKSNRAAGGGNGILLRGTNCRIINCSLVDNPNSGILLNGVTYSCADNLIENCNVTGNSGVGISQHTVVRSKISRTFIRARSEIKLSGISGLA